MERREVGDLERRHPLGSTWLWGCRNSCCSVQAYGDLTELCISTGHCTWGMNCRFIHPGVNDKGNYSLISKPEPFSPNGAPPIGPHPLMPANPWVWTPLVGIPGFCTKLLAPEEELKALFGLVLEQNSIHPLGTCFLKGNLEIRSRGE